MDPQKPHGDLYDSVVDNPSNPAIFVVFEFDQCYPEFLISYVATKPVAAARYNKWFTGIIVIDRYNSDWQV